MYYDWYGDPCSLGDFGDSRSRTRDTSATGVSGHDSPRLLRATSFLTLFSNLDETCAPLFWTRRESGVGWYGVVCRHRRHVECGRGGQKGCESVVSLSTLGTKGRRGDLWGRGGPECRAGTNLRQVPRGWRKFPMWTGPRSE